MLPPLSPGGRPETLCNKPGMTIGVLPGLVRDGVAPPSRLLTTKLVATSDDEGGSGALSPLPELSTMFWMGLDVGAGVVVTTTRLVGVIVSAVWLVGVRPRLDTTVLSCVSG